MSDAFRINRYQQPVNLLEISARTTAAGARQKTDQAAPASGTSFQAVLGSELSGSPLSFSKHAATRLQSRGVQFSPEQLQKISDGIDRAEQKGSKETLVLSDDAAMVVSVKNRTVITVFDKTQLREGVVTAIDSAVIL